MSDINLSKIDFESLRSTSESSTIIVEDVTPSTDEMVLAVLLVSLILGLMIYAFRKLKVIEKLKASKKLILSCFTAWAIWCFCVLFLRTTF